MAKRISTALRNFVSRHGSWSDAMGNGVLMFFNQTQPTSAEAAFNSTGAYPLVAFTEGAGIVTKEVAPYSSFEITPTTPTNQITSIKVAGLEILAGPFTVGISSSTAATALINAINTCAGPIKFTAKLKPSSTSVVIVTAPKGSGARLTDKSLYISRTGSGDVAVKINNQTALTWTSDAYTVSGGASAQEAFGPTSAVAGYADEGTAGANLLNLTTQTTDGYSAKESASWQGVAGSDAINTALGTAGFAASFSSGTVQAGWFRWYASMDDPELTGTATADTNKAYIRYDGSIATSGGDMTATGGTSIVYGATHTQNSFAINVPEAQ